MSCVHLCEAAAGAERGRGLKASVVKGRVGQTKAALLSELQHSSKLAELKEQVARGDYRVQTQSLAEKILRLTPGRQVPGLSVEGNDCTDA